MRLRLAYIFISVTMLCCLAVSLEKRALAYIDPGSGLFIIQSVGGFFAGVLYVIRKRIKALIFHSAPMETAVTDPAEPTKKG